MVALIPFDPCLHVQGYFYLTPSNALLLPVTTPFFGFS